MQLDRTHVAIRSRTFSEIGDLAFMLIRQYPQAILVGLSVGVLPWLVADTLLLGWLPWSETATVAYDEETLVSRYRYAFLTATLIFLQAPLAGILTTYYIGQAVFEERPTWRNVFRETSRIAPRLLWSLGVFRGAIPAMFVVGLAWSEIISAGAETFWLVLILIWAMAVRSFRPFLPEILVLERCPLRKGKADQITARRRSSLLHSPIGGDLLGRFMLGGVLFVLLACALFFSAMWANQQLFNSVRWSLVNMLVLLPVSLWLTVGLATVIRFLSYLDSRIRLEGWEVELMLRAEAMRQFGDHTSPPKTAPVAGGTSS